MEQLERDVKGVLEVERECQEATGRWGFVLSTFSGRKGTDGMEGGGRPGWPWVLLVTVDLRLAACARTSWLVPGDGACPGPH